MGSRTRLAQAYYDLSAMLEAGMPILRSLDVVIEGRQGYFKHVLAQIRESLSQGSGLAEAMDKHHTVFPEMDRMLIQAGETSGSLGDSFKMLSQWHEFVHRITWRMLTRMAYPVLSLHAAAFIVSFPDLFLGQISPGEYLLKALTILLIFYIPAVLVTALLHFRIKADVLRLVLDHLVLRIPILNQAVYHLSICRHARAFSMLYKAGVPISECTERANRATGNAVVARLFAGSVAAVRGGGLACEGFSDRLPAEYRDLWRIGEEAGELDKTVDKVADIAGDRADLYFNEFGRWFPIVVWAVIAAILVCMIFKIAAQIPSFSGNF